ncbi:hypothetical protein [Endozoicomonas elysicola]|uniref:Uncharacterized protein n=1 Tax=Endozoicomonas elysicola TaxID=305900 RepID=A0A081KCW7_9GAMM|nr:hypothetical protein [Endozoicomonas elysicola]KEI71993.1 hypothetical protein GV64_15785 [Endozoicomonas elysicola]
MGGVSGSGELQAKQLELSPAELVAKAMIEEAGDKVKLGFEQTNSVSQGRPDTVESILSSPATSVPTLPAVLPDATAVSSEDIQGLQTKAQAARDTLGLLSSREQAPAFSDNNGVGALEESAQQSSDVRGLSSSPLEDVVAKVQAGVTGAADPDVQGAVGIYESNVRQLAESIQQAPDAEQSPSLQALSIIASTALPSAGSIGSLVLQRVIDDIVSLNRSSKGESTSGDLHTADLYGIPEHVRLSLLSERLGIDLNPLVRTREEYLEGIAVTQRGVFLSLEALSNAEFLERLQEARREAETKDEQNREVVEKLKQAIAALKAGEPKFAAEILNSASLITTAIEQIVARYTSDETPGSLRQHLKEHLAEALGSVIREGSHQDMMKRRIELLQSATRA